MAVILIVDDEAPVRRVLARWIEAAGHDVREADSADAALRDIEIHPPAVVFSDIQMPGRGGLWLTAQLRKHHSTTAVVLATAVSTVAPRLSMQAGVIAYVVKPFTKASIMDALSLALEWQREPAPSSGATTREELQTWLDSLE